MEYKEPERRINAKDKEFIISHLDLPDWPDEKISEHLGLKPVSVKNMREKLGGTVKKKLDLGTIEKIKERLKSVTSEEERRFLYRQEFVISPRSKRLGMMFSADDYQIVVEKWSDYKAQLSDMTASEEDILEKMIILDIRIINNQKSMRQCQMAQEVLRKQMNKKGELDPEDDKDLQILQTIDAQNSQELELNKQYQMLLREYHVLHESLNATRKQREERHKIGAETFFDLVKKLSEKDVRDKVGRVTDLQKRSMKKKLEDLSKPHKYSDNTFDAPILDGDNIK